MTDISVINEQSNHQNELPASNGEQSLKELLITIDNINPRKLSSRSHANYIKQIVTKAMASLSQDPTVFLLLIGSIKECQKPCYKRDLLLEVLDRIVNKEASLFTKLLLCQISKVMRRKNLWKELANSISSLPDLVANCRHLDKYPAFKLENFYPTLSRRIYSAFECFCSKTKTNSNAEFNPNHVHDGKNHGQDNDTGDTANCDHRFYILQLIGRISISSGGRLALWDELYSKILASGNETMRKLFTDMVTIPFDPNKAEAKQHFATFIEPLCLLPIHSVLPSQDSGSQICACIGSHVLHNKSLQYVICNKQLLQTNFHCDSKKQNVILFNIFAYLAYLTKPREIDINKDLTTSSLPNDKPTIINTDSDSLLIQTLLCIAKSWASGTKVLLRTYQQNKYITKTLVIALRYSLRYDEQSLAANALELQSIIVNGLPTYLNRATSENRNLAICLAEIMMPRLHDLIDSQSSGHRKGSTDKLELNFDIKLNDDCLGIKRLFETDDLGKIFPMPSDFASSTGSSIDFSQIREKVEFNSDAEDRRRENMTKKQRAEEGDKSRGEDYSSAATIEDSGVTSVKILHNTSTLDASKQGHSSKRAVVEIVESNIGVTSRQGHETNHLTSCDTMIENSDDDLEPYDTNNEIVLNADGGSFDEADAIGEEAADVPIYLSDCINGLIEDKSARYVRLCLVKAGELLQQLILDEQIRELSKQTELASRRYHVKYSSWQAESSSSSSGTSLMSPSSNTSVSSNRNDNSSIRDIANELAQILLYLDDHFNIEGFDSYRMKALDLLCVAAPDLVVKYLLDEFNGPNKNTRHQLDILQLLVSSARQLSSSSSQPSDYGKDDNDYGNVGSDNSRQREPIDSRLNRREIAKEGEGFAAKSNCLIGGGGDDDGTNRGKLSTTKSTKADFVRTLSMKKTPVTGNKTRDIPKSGNKFVKYASLYFYGIVHKLKAELNSAVVNVDQPTNIVSAVRSYARASSNTDNKRESMIRRVITGLANSRSRLNGLESDLVHSMSLLDGGGFSFGRGGARQFDSSSSFLPDNRLLGSTGTLSQQQAQQQQRQHQLNGGGTKTLEKAARVQGDNIAADDSYLLSRIFFSLSLIIKCLNQQPITCRLSNDLLDILAAYRYHADVGVRRAILACLKSIHDATPSVYFSEFLHDKTINLFGSWLAKESDLLLL